MTDLIITYKGNDAVSEALRIVDQAAEKKRISLATSIYGQDTLYLQKSVDAERFLTDGTVSPMIEADMDAYNITAQQAVDNIQSARQGILQQMKKIETIRLRDKEQIRQTTDNPFIIAKQAKADIEAVSNGE